MESASVDSIKPDIQGLTQTLTQTLTQPATSDSNSMMWFILQIILFSVLFYGMLSTLDISEIANNWPKYRCSPTIMPFASLYGKNASDNFNYCMKNMFMGQVGSVTGPFSGILGTVIETLMTFLKNINSLRVMVATLVGGITKVFQEFVNRFKVLFNQVRTSSLRVQFLMKRVFATFVAVIYMGSSAITAGLNFGDTFLFRFLDTFCFSPKTIVHIKNRGYIPIDIIELGDVFEKTGAIVTAKYRFLADGQPMTTFLNTDMIFLNGKLNKTMDTTIKVSTNHYIKNRNTWVRSENHPDASSEFVWTEGELVCLDTDTHEIPIGGYIFSDYMETNVTDSSTMKYIDTVLNNTKNRPIKTNKPNKTNQNNQNNQTKYNYEPCIDPEAICSDVNKPLKDIQIGDRVGNDFVFGKVDRLVDTIVHTPTFMCSPSQLLWDTSTSSWVRAGELYPIEILEVKKRFTTIYILGTASFKINGQSVRDGMELYSPDTEEITASAMLDK